MIDFSDPVGKAMLPSAVFDDDDREEFYEDFNDLSSFDRAIVELDRACFYAEEAFGIDAEESVRYAIEWALRYGTDRNYVVDAISYVRWALFVAWKCSQWRERVFVAKDNHRESESAEGSVEADA